MTLPIPDHAALAHSEKLTRYIREEINKSDGHITFARFMELALYAPGLGYYSAGTHKFGKGGDFVTAPEISPLFAQSIARQIQQIITQLDTTDILELGAGSGVFAKDLLFELKKLGTLPKHYYILEVSAELRERQKQLLHAACPEMMTHITWLDTLPRDFTGVIFANEVLDAMPVHCFEIGKNEIVERSVTWTNNQFAWMHTQPASVLAARIRSIQQEYLLSDGYQSEINVIQSAWIKSLAEILKKGLLLLIDYGYGRSEYYHPERRHGTLKCFFQHHHHDDPFKYIGLQDITAHIDFTAIAESAANANLHVSGYTNQAAFLLSCGLLSIAEQNQLDTVQQYQQSQAIKMLTLPAQMGELIKVMALTKQLDTPLLGFALQDRRHDL